MMSAPVSRPPRPNRDKSQKPAVDTNKTTDGSTQKIQPTAEQIRIAQIINDTKDTDDPELQNKIRQVVELTGKSNDEASVALHDCDNDPNRAIDMLLEGDADQGEWETSGKRKKSRQPSVTIVEPPPVVTPGNKENRQRPERPERLERRERDSGKEQLRNRAPPRLNRGRGRDAENNERNLEDSRSRDKSGERRNKSSRMLNGAPSSRGGGRGRVGSGIGRVRTFQNRGAAQSRFTRPIDTWTNASTEQADAEQPMSVGNWSDGFPTAEDWDNEDWTGSLAETKVFTPSAHVAPSDLNDSSVPGLGIAPTLPPQSLPAEESLCLSSTARVTAVGTTIYDADDVSSMDPLPVATTSTETLSIANHLKSFSTLTSCSMDNASNLPPGISPMQNPPKSTASVTTNSLSTGINSSRASMQSVTQQLRPKVQRSRGPTSSTKIPSSAVEMPEDTIANLDVQFGSLEFGSEQSSLGFSSPIKSGISLQSGVSSLSNQSVVQNSTQPPSSSAGSSSSLSSSILRVTTSNLLKNGSDMGNSGEVLQASTPTYTPVSASLIATSKDGVQPILQTPVSQISNPDVGSYSNSVDSRKASSAPFSGVQRNNSSTGTLESVGNKLTDSSSMSVYGLQEGHSVQQSAYGNHKPNNTFPHHHHSNVNSVQQVQNQSLYGSGGGNASLVQAAVSSFSSVPSAYGQVQTQQQQQSSFGQSSVYASPGATVSTYASGSSISQTGYSSQSHSSLHSSTMAGPKMASSLTSTVKEVLDSTASQHMYDNTSAAVLTSTPTTPDHGGSSTTSVLGLTAGTLSSNNSTVKSAVSTNKAALPSLPPGVSMVHGHQYIMGQAGVPFYSLQQPMYAAYDDLQMVQQRLPMASYYDMSFQPSTTLTGRDGGLTNVAYSNTEGKFARGENSSPVPTTMSQQQAPSQQHQQAYLNPTPLPHGYGYYYPSQLVGGAFAQYGTPIFPMPPATNAHGATTNTHFQKPNAYGSHGYTSGYENLGQNQDYTKNSYGSNSQSQSKVMAGTSAGGTVNSVGGNDITASVYSKAHSQMSKQTYDKPGFHAGTPPPFNLAGTQPGSLGAPSTAYATQFIPMMTQHPSPMMHHQLHQDSGNASQRVNSAQNKATASSKQGYGTSYWNTT